MNAHPREQFLAKFLSGFSGYFTFCHNIQRAAKYHFFSFTRRVLKHCYDKKGITPCLWNAHITTRSLGILHSRIYQKILPLSPQLECVSEYHFANPSMMSINPSRTQYQHYDQCNAHVTKGLLRNLLSNIYLKVFPFSP